MVEMTVVPIYAEDVLRNNLPHASHTETSQSGDYSHKEEKRNVPSQLCRDPYWWLRI